MSSPSDFVIVNGVLKKYVGPGGDVVVPEGVTSIGKEAFEYCRSLTSITLPASVTSIGDGAFRGCKKLADAEGFVIVKGILFDYDGLGGDVIVPAGVTSIEGLAFSNCSSLRSVTLPAGVTSIGYFAFEDCSSLTSITLPDSVKSIDYRAFYKCRSLTNITLPESVTSIGDEAFCGCEKLTDVNGFVIVKGILFEYTGHGGKVVVPDGVKSIGYQAFRFCSKLTSITLPEGVTSIDDEAFDGCSTLTSINLPEGLTSIGNCAFYNCSRLRSITLPESVTSIGGRAFKGCKKLADAEGFVIVKGILFDYTGPGGDVVVPEGVTSIGSYAFEDCSSLTSITLPAGVTSIGWSAFNGCSSLKSITLPENVTTIEDYAFEDCSSLRSINLPEGVTSIGNEAFRGCIKLANADGFVIAKGILFDYTKPGGNVVVPEGVTSIGNEAFHHCSNLKSVSLPESIKSVGRSAFSGCNKKIAIKIPNTAANRLENFDIQNSVLENYKGPGGDVVVPAGVTSIGDKAFEYCISLTSITLPESVTSIGNRAFSDCSSLTSITLPDSVTSIGDRAFSGCSSLTSITLPESVTSIGNRAFSSCSSLTSITLPESVTSIGNRAFSDCSSLTSITVPDGVNIIRDSTFWGCRKLTSITLPQNLTSIEYCTFYGCSSLTSVTLPDRVSGIVRSAFYGCRSLTSIALPAGLTNISYDAFKKCKSLTTVSLPEGKDAAWLAELDTDGQLSGCFSDLNDLCREADEQRMAQLISRAGKWSSKWKKLFFTSYLHSNTRAALMLAEKRGELSQYAAMRGLDEDELRDRTLSDLGLDAQGCKAYDLGNQTVTARLQKDLRFTLETQDGKTVGTLPKKGADPEKYAAAKADLAQMKKDADKIWKNRADVLLRDFLSDRARTEEYWKTTYGGNPILHGVACLLVWEQGGACFARTDAGTVCADGTPYVLNGGPIRVAHPMEMKPRDVEAWQHYFTSRGLKQPFEQVWEPVTDASLVKPGRYDGCTVPLYALMNKEKHGIVMEGQKKLTLRDCSAELEFLAGHHDWINNEFEVKNFSFTTYTRQVNHIVAMLDKATVAGRVKKDDVTVVPLLDRFTLAQITEFISAAQEANAVNVLAALLEYKNNTFPDFDPMDEFTLEW